MTSLTISIHSASPYLEWHGLALVLAAGGSALTRYRITSLYPASSPQFEKIRRAMRVCVLAALCIFPIGWLPLSLWVLGVIPTYEIALVLSVLIGVTGLVLGVWQGRRTGHT